MNTEFSLIDLFHSFVKSDFFNSVNNSGFSWVLWIIPVVVIALFFGLPYLADKK